MLLRAAGAADLGGTNMQVAVVDEMGRIVSRRHRPTDAGRGPERIVADLAEALEEACAEAGGSTLALDAVGVAAAGAIDLDRGVVLVSPNLGWEDLPLRDMLAAAIERPVLLENDVNAATWGEHRFGAGAGREGDALGVWVGTGVGGGLVLGGRIHHGDLSTAGEIGHTLIAPEAKPGARKIEDLCSRTAMLREIAAALASGAGASRLSASDALDGAALARAFHDGDPLVRDVVDRAATHLGIAIANVVTLLSIRSVYLGGGVTESLGAEWVKRVAASFRAEVFPPELAAGCAILPTLLAADAGLVGAALAALASLD